jgi:serine/threonine-protein kinase PRP4
LTKVADTAGGDAIPSNTKDDGAAISAADYDPIRDRADDEERRRKDAVADGVGEPVKVDAPKEEDEYEEVEISEDEDEDDDVDMFAAFDGEEKPKKKRKVTVRRRKQPGANGEIVTEVIRPKKASVLDVVDNVDDTDGYYRITPGEILDDGRYQITVTLGKGMFSAVVKAKVLKAVDRERRQDVVGKEVAIKVIRSQESMWVGAATFSETLLIVSRYVAGRKEAQILKKLNEADPEDKKHIVRMEHLFEHRGHLCIVTESLRCVVHSSD